MAVMMVMKMMLLLMMIIMMAHLLERFASRLLHDIVSV